MSEFDNNLSSFDESLLSMVAMGALTAEDVRRYRQNYNFFNHNRHLLEEQFDCRWVASIEQEFYDSEYLNNLQEEIETIPFSERAYIEHIHRGFPQANIIRHKINPSLPSYE